MHADTVVGQPQDKVHLIGYLSIFDLLDRQCFVMNIEGEDFGAECETDFFNRDAATFLGTRYQALPLALRGEVLYDYRHVQLTWDVSSEGGSDMRSRYVGMCCM